MKHLLSTLFMSMGLTCAAQTAAPIHIDVSQRGTTVSPNLYGIFFEEISHAGDGGLYAELVQNRGFEEHVLPSSMTYRDGRAVAIDSRNYEHGNNRRWSIPWNVEEKKYTAWSTRGIQCDVQREVKEMAAPLHPNTPHAMQLTISNMQRGGKAQLINTGYWGMGLKSGEKYDLRFYVKSSDYKGTITARLIDQKTGTDYGSIDFQKRKMKNWTEYTGVIESSGTTGQGSLALEFDAKGTVLVDYVSLFPRHTFMNRKNGQRKDLAKMLQNLHPRFMRWPGGCIVEGATYENRVKWKETLGDPMTRRGEWDVWGYRATWGMGYHEFLQFCEDLGMDGMFVDNAGMSCSVRNGDYTDTQAGLDSCVQDFRDAIEYALGDPAKNKWAKMRADAGHPKPFPLKYVEIGNENVGPEYVKHFNYIFKVLKAEYPQITFINTLAHDNRLLDQIPGEYMVDPHWYRDPNFFFNNNNLFDNASRKHDIYVGEYACNSGVGGGNLLAAISEAAFIMGMERNSDVVKMTSYAPLFENVNRKDWPCNLIHFNSNQTFGRASYYVQQMMAENRPTYNVYVSETSSSADSKPFPVGQFALGTYATQCEYRDVQITTADGRVTQYKPSDFQQMRGTWKVEGDVIAQTSNEQNAMAMLQGFSGNDYTVTLKARKTGGREGFFLYYGMDGRGRNGYVVNIAGWDNRTTCVQPVSGGRASDNVSPQVPQSVETGRWYDVRIVVKPQSTVFYVDGREVTTAKPLSQTRQFCQTGYDEQTGELVIKVVNGTDQPYTRQFDIAGAERIEPRGRIITLSGDANAENTFDQPTKLAPVTTMYAEFGPHFQYQFAPMSLTIMRVRVAGQGLARAPRMGRPTNFTDPDAHDPVMAKGEDGRYYCFMTGMNVGVMSSEDMHTWRHEPSALKQTPQWARDTVPGYNGHTWAPDISYHGGKWYLYYSCSTFGKNGSAIGLATNKTLDPKSPDFGWVDQGMVIASHRRLDNWNAIDPNLIVDRKGQPWLTYGSFWDGIQLVKLSKDDFRTPLTKPVTIARRLGKKLSLQEMNDEKNFTREGNNVIEAGENAIEAPFIFYHDGYYYLFVSFDYCCRGQNSTYKTVYGRSKKVEGPYLDRSGREMAYGGGTLLYGPDDDYFGVGHSSAYEFDGQCYFISHAYEKEKNGAAKLFVRPMNFDRDGWIIEE